MKNIYAMFALHLLLSIPIIAQVTITKDELNLAPGNTAAYRQISQESSMMVFQEAENTPGGLWDFSNLVTTDIIKYLNRDEVLSTDAYPNASYKFNNSYSMAGVTLEAREYELAGPNSLVRIGLDLDSSFITMGSLGATLAIRKQKSDYIPALVKMNFPLEYNNSNEYKSVSTRKIFGLANIPGMGITDAETIYQVTYSRDFSVSNWGKVKLYAAGNEIDVLVMKYKETSIDTVLMNGMPLPDFMLEPLGLKQGAQTIAEGYVFYGKGYGEYLLNIGRITNQYGSESFAGYGLSELVTSIEEQKEPIINEVYPNPTDGSLNIILPNSTGSRFLINIYNSMGNIVYESETHGGLRNYTISLGNELPAGVYNIVVTERANGKMVSRSFVLAR